MNLLTQTVWVIMTKDREYIATGVPRNRALTKISNQTDKYKTRILTYGSKKKAEAGFTASGFYGGPKFDSWEEAQAAYKNPHSYLEAVEVTMTMDTVE